MKAKKFTVNFHDDNATASIYMNEIELDSKKYLQAYFIIDDANKTDKETESAYKKYVKITAEEKEKGIKYKEVYICHADGLKLTIANTSEDELTAEEAHAVFLRSCKLRDIDPTKCSNYNSKIS